MSRTKIRYQDIDDEDDLRDILRDGERMHVDMSMMDSARNLHDDTARASHRPGFRIADAQRRDLSVYDEYDVEISNSWKKPPSGFGSGEFVGQREGDLCTIDGAPGRLRKDDDGNLVCMPDHPRGRRDTRTLDEIVQDHRLRMIEEYDAYDRNLAESWRRP